MRVSPLPALASLTLVLTMLLPLSATARQASWLDGDLASWNTPGMNIPAAPVIDGNTDPRCAENQRPAETAEDDALIAQGWKLFAAYQRGWGVTLISGLSGYDGMCRPLGYQSFVFVDGVFAGTIAPQPMDARTDGASNGIDLYNDNQLWGEFVRYTADDPLCCPSGSTAVNYTVDETADGPVLNPVQS
jgi:hypothetical protein